jgi:co-chaperonin GroES (HSP10)
MKVVGKIKPLGAKVFVANMEFGEQKTASGLVILSDNAKSSGIHPRWARVWAVGDEQTEVKVGEWILIDHGRWTRTIEYENDDGSITELRMVDNDAILIQSDEEPEDVVQRVVPGHFSLNVSSSFAIIRIGP